MIEREAACANASGRDQQHHGEGDLRDTNALCKWRELPAMLRAPARRVCSTPPIGRAAPAPARKKKLLKSEAPRENKYAPARWTPFARGKLPAKTQQMGEC